jgi:Ferredoxin
MAKVTIADCIGCGACTGVCPDVFDLGDDGLAFSVVGDDIPEELVNDAKEAAEACPVEAITIE